MTKKKAVKAIKKAVTKALHKGVSENAVNRAVDSSVRQGEEGEPSSKLNKAPKTKAILKRLKAEGDLNSD